MTPETVEEQLRALKHQIAMLEARDAAQRQTIDFYVEELERLARERAQAKGGES